VSDVLERILATTREDVARRRREQPLGELDEASRRRPGAFRDALNGPGISIIAEHKRRSPSAGPIRDGASVTEIVQSFERGGAAALSILTEEHNFDGSLADLRQARAASELPILRKDFIVDAYQLHEAAAAGADAVLLIVAALTADELADLHGAAQRLGLDVLVEVHDDAELERALAIEAAIIGINNRDLRDFSVDPQRTIDLLPRVPAGVTVVSESGLDGAARLAELHDAGVHAALIGEALMRAPDPAAALRLLTSAR
jgi:indole-3-glycerol phosphate synthase